MTERNSAEIERDIAETRKQMSNTLDALQERLSPGQMMDEMMHYFKGSDFRRGAGDFARNVGRSVRDNPLPLALVGTGLAWMMLSRGRRHDPDGDGWHEEDRASRYGALHEARGEYQATVPGSQARSGLGMSSYTGGAPQETSYSTPGGGASSTSPDDMGSPTERARRAAEEARARASGYGYRASEAAHEAGERASGMAADARERVSDVAAGARARFGGARRRVARTGREMGDRARHAGERARHGADRVGREVGDLWHEQPLVFGALGLAVGALIGIVLPATRREDEWLGETRDEFGRAALARGREELDKAQEVVARATEAAAGEAERQGLTPEGATESLKSAGRSVGDRVTEAQHAAEAKVKETEDKVRKVGEAAKDAAKDEAERQDLGGTRWSSSTTSKPQEQSGESSPFRS